MELTKLGFDDWFEEKLKENPTVEYRLARVSAVDRDNYLVVGEKDEMLANIEGKLRYQAESSMDLPAVGDWVYVKYYNDYTFAIIHEVLPRRTFLRRKTAGKSVEYQLISANIDTALIMQSLDANFNLRRLERYLVAVNEGNIKPVILLSKADLLSVREIGNKISMISQLDDSLNVIVFSNKTGEGLDKIRSIIKSGKTYCLIGSSGVGKTTMLNRLLGGDIYATSEVREKDNRGRHTTNRRQLIILKTGGLVIDTPGMREFGNISVDTGLTETFADIYDISKKCRFSDCMHIDEPGCAIVDAIKKGELDIKRFKSYEKLRKEADYNKMTYVEKRKKDKKFGKFCKKVMKHHKKNMK